MKRAHFETFQPVCPVCLGRPGAPETPLSIAEALREEAGDILEGRLSCSSTACQLEFPILEGIPYLVPDPRSFLSQHVNSILQRRGLPQTLGTLLGDCCGPGSAFDATRQHLSNYTWDHYADLDPQEEEGEPKPGSARAILERGLSYLTGHPQGLALDVGCSVGRTTFELAARSEHLVLGIDLHVLKLRAAGEVLREARVRYARRRVGLVYEQREFPVDLPGRERVDFWCCDGTRLPFRSGSVALATSLNVIDCVPSPLDHLRTLARVLQPTGPLVLTSPYDWSTGATQLESWVGGHSQRGGPHHGQSDSLMRALLTGGHPASVEELELVAEEMRVPWQVRLHDRAAMTYQTHLLVAKKKSE